MKPKTNKTSIAKLRLKVPTSDTMSDMERMVDLATFTAKSFETQYPTPFGAEIIETTSQKRVIRCLNHVGQHTDPSQHAEVHAVRKACKKLKSVSLKGHTLFTTCEPCPMCMSAILWSGLDSVVFAATIEDASKFCDQIHISADEVSKRSDMPCKVIGPVGREMGLALFEDSRMRSVYRMWKRKKE